MRDILRIFGTLALFGMLATFGPATAAQIQLNAGAPYLCAVVQGGSTAPGTPVIAYPCSGGPEDQWNFVQGQFQGIGTAKGVSMCLDFAPGTVILVVQNTCNGGRSQQWQILNGNLASLGTGPAATTVISNVQNEGCVDSSGGPSVGGGTQLVIDTCTGAPSQNWIMGATQFQLVGKAPYLCANVKGSKTAKGTPVLAYSCDDAPNELWYFEDGHIYGIGTEDGTLKCLDWGGGNLVVLNTW